jgi:hypothetical protein
VGVTGILITATVGFGAGSLCMLIQLWLRLPAGLPQSMRVAGAVIAGAAMSIAGYRMLAADRAKQSAAVTLVSALLDANWECMKLIDVDGRLLRVPEYGATLMDAESPLEVAGADWQGFWKGDDSAAAKSAFAGARAGNRTSFRGLCHITTGRPKWWDSQLIPIKDDAGRVVAVGCSSWAKRTSVHLEMATLFPAQRFRAKMFFERFQYRELATFATVFWFFTHARERDIIGSLSVPIRSKAPLQISLLPYTAFHANATVMVLFDRQGNDGILYLVSGVYLADLLAHGLAYGAGTTELAVAGYGTLSDQGKFASQQSGLTKHAVAVASTAWPFSIASTANPRWSAEQYVTWESTNRWSTSRRVKGKAWRR